MSLTSENQNLQTELKCLDFSPELVELVFWYSVVLPPWPPGQRLRSRDVHVKLFTLFIGDAPVISCTWDPESFLDRGNYLAEVTLSGLLDSETSWVTTTDIGITGPHQRGPKILIQEFGLDWMRAVRVNGCMLCNVKKQTPEICLAAVEQNVNALRFVNLQTPEICLSAVKRDGYALCYVKKQTPQLCLAAVEQNGCALGFVDIQTPEICLAAVRQNGNALRYVGEQNPQICLAAVEQDGNALEYVTLQTSEICFTAINQNPDALKYVKLNCRQKTVSKF